MDAFGPTDDRERLAIAMGYTTRFALFHTREMLRSKKLEDISGYPSAEIAEVTVPLLTLGAHGEDNEIDVKRGCKILAILLQSARLTCDLPLDDIPVAVRYDYEGLSMRALPEGDAAVRLQVGFQRKAA